MSPAKKLSRFAVALGGFLIFVGVLVIAVFVISFLGVVDFSIVELENLQNLALWILLVIGLLDLMAGVILWRR